MKIRFNPEMIKRAEDSIRDKLKKILQSEELLKQVSDAAIQDIKYQARRGIVTVDGKQTGRMSKLTPKWIKQRKKISESTTTHEAFSPARSNITLSGQLLDSLSARVVKGKAKTSIELYFAGDHKPYSVKGRNGIRRVGKQIKNSKLSEYVGMLRPFFSIHNRMIERLKTIVIRYIRRNI